METNTRTLHDIVEQSTNDNRHQDTFLICFNTQLTTRFPDLTDWRNISYNDVRNLAEFCTAVNIIGLEVYNEVTQGDRRKFQQQRRERVA